MEDDGNEGFDAFLSRKEKKKRSRELKKAQKSKRKAATFMERTEKSRDNQQAFQVLTIDDDEVGSDGEVEILDENEQIEMDEDALNDTFVSNDGVEEDAANEELDSMSLPYMRDFDIGIQYRKLNCNSVLVAIEPFKALYFAGKALIQVVKGVVDIYGYRFGVNGQKYMVFSARGHSSLVCVQAVSRNDAANEIPEANDDISVEELMSATGALIIMEGFENEWCDGMRHTYPEAGDIIGPVISGIGPGKLPIQKRFMDKLGFQLIKGSRSDKFKMMKFPSYWDDIFSDLVNQFDCSTGKICAFGGKGVGKSTFVKWLMNRFLGHRNGDEVLFIDLDPGQTEFTPPGMISVHVCTEPIFGPNFTHLKDSVRAVYLGTVSVADHPITYINAVVELYEYCLSNERFRGIPWVVNTMGFSQGLGVQIACEIVKIIRPSCVIQLKINNNYKRNFPFFLNKENVANHRSSLTSRVPEKYRQPLEDYHFLTVNSAMNCESTTNTNVWGANARTCREMVMISYFAEKIGSAEGFSIKSVVPLRVPLDSVAIGTIDSDLSYNGILTTMNGNLVALCEMPDANFETVEGTQRKFIAKAKKYTNNCLGYGIVRAVDRQGGTLYVVTPVNETDILLKVNVILAGGTVGLPVHFYANPAGANNSSVEVPYLMNRSEGTSTLHSAAKKFFVPKRVTHSVLKNCVL